MRNRLVTSFWKNALESLPSGLRSRYLHDIEAAERWELRLNAAVESTTSAALESLNRRASASLRLRSNYNPSNCRCVPTLATLSSCYRLRV